MDHDIHLDNNKVGNNKTWHLFDPKSMYIIEKETLKVHDRKDLLAYYR
jgi:hypothetical protein